MQALEIHNYPEANEIGTNPTQQYTNEWVELDNGVVVHRFNYCMSADIGYAAYEPSKLAGPHHTITRYKDSWYGEIRTRHISPELDAMKPYSEERSAAVHAHYDLVAAVARGYILQAFPNAKFGR